MKNQSRKIYLIYSPTVEQQLDQVTQHTLAREQGIEFSTIKFSELSSIHIYNDLNHALLWIEQKDYPVALKIAFQKNMSLGFLPIAKDTPSRFLSNLDLPIDFDECMEVALRDDPVLMDLIQCNGEVIINGVNLLNQTTMAEFFGDSGEFKGFYKFKFLFKRFFHAFSLTPHPITLITAKEKKISTAITGMVLLDFHKNGPLLNLYKESISLKDGRISVALFAPQSILTYLQLSSSAFLSSQKKELFQQLGYIRTEALTITSPVDTHYLINNKPLTTRELKLESLSKGLHVNAGQTFSERQQYTDEKENVSCDQLPQQEDRVKYLSKTLPFFSHAMESDFKELFLTLKESASTTGTYVLLMVLSSLLATLGLFLNSPSIVIGAMVLAPLMSPIISLSMGVLRSDSELSKKAFLTLFIGMFIALSLSASIAFILPFQEVTNEIEGRLHPSTLDLLVAVLSGVAGAYANARENIAKSLPGVAIAVALVPPLCVSGVGIGWLNYEVFSGAMLLFLTNLTGIIMAAGLSFIVMGFAPFSRAKKGVLLSVILVSAISVPLVLSFSNMRKMASIKQQLLSQNYQISGQTIKLSNIKIRSGSPIRVSANLISTRMPNHQILILLEQQLSKQLEIPISVDFSVHLVTNNYF